MASAKQLSVRPISAADANRIVKALHYSGLVVSNSQVHLGVFLDGRCGGAMQFGPSLDKRKIQPLVAGTKWNEFIELNRMAFADWLPRNGESRCLGYAMRWLRRTYPWLKWVLSFSDASQCGDGTIYRASGFLLTGIKENKTIWRAPTGEVFTDISLRLSGKARQRAAELLAAEGHAAPCSGASSMLPYRNAGWTPIPGFQLRYIYFLDQRCVKDLSVPVLPFSEIDRRGAGMYLGQPRARSVDSDAPADQAGEGGATPTRAL